MSWMADLVPRAVRGRYFSRRNNVCNLVALALSVATGLALDRWGGGGAEALARLPREVGLAGFSAIFGGAVLMGVTSLVLLKRQVEPARPVEPAPARSHDVLLAPFRDAAFRRVLVFFGFFWGVNGLGNPFWTPFVLQDLGRGFGFVTILGFLGGLCGLATLPLWGRLIDRVGSKPVIAAVVVVTATHPLYYLVARPDFVAPIYLDAISSGIVWGGFNLAIFNLVLAAAPLGPGREMYYAAHNAVGGLAMAAASALAGTLAAALDPVEVLGRTFTPRQEIFAAVTVLRIVSLVLLWRVIEPPRGACRAPAPGREAVGATGERRFEAASVA
jgi:hypothetical protein